MLCLVSVSRVNSLFSILRNLYINKAKRYMSFKGVTTIREHTSAHISYSMVILELPFSCILSQLCRHASFYWCHSLCHFCAWVSWYYILELPPSTKHVVISINCFIFKFLRTLRDTRVAIINDIVVYTQNKKQARRMWTKDVSTSDCRTKSD